MDEKIYSTMKGVGITNVVIGILTMAAGIAMGTVVLVNGARLLKQKSGIIF